jgi:hypothetical protein
MIGLRCFGVDPTDARNDILAANRQRIASFFPPDYRSGNVVSNRQRIAQIVTLRTATASLSFVRDLSP